MNVQYTAVVKQEVSGGLAGLRKFVGSIVKNAHVKNYLILLKITLRGLRSCGEDAIDLPGIDYEKEKIAL